jgi:hypothetical protein
MELRFRTFESRVGKDITNRMIPSVRPPAQTIDRTRVRFGGQPQGKSGKGYREGQDFPKAPRERDRKLQI